MLVNEKIQSLIDSHDVTIFIKGNKDEPRCGFSAQAVHLLLSYKIPFQTVDILLDPELRAGLKVFSDWPTFPQLYIKGEFIGGIDIMKQMYETGEFSRLVAQISSEVAE